VVRARPPHNNLYAGKILLRLPSEAVGVGGERQEKINSYLNSSITKNIPDKAIDIIIPGAIPSS